MSAVLDKPLVTPKDIGVDQEGQFSPHPYAAGRQYTPNYRVICSIIPHKLEHWMFHGGGRKQYLIPETEKGKYNLLRVYDTYTMIADLARRAMNDDNAGDAMTPAPVHCQGLVEDLLRIFGGDGIGNKSGQHPGIMMIEGDVPTQAELDHLVEMHTAYCRSLVVEGDDYFIRGYRGSIIDEHREAAKWLGVEDREWYKKMEARANKHCPRCAEDIISMATLCKHCRTDLIRYYGDQKIEVTEEMDPGVFYHNLRIKAQKG